MSGINITYGITNQIANGAGELNFFEETALKKAPSIAEIIAGDVVNEILENALDIATRASDTSITWKNIEEENTMEMCEKSNSVDVNNLCADIISDIVNNINSQQQQNIEEIIDGLNSITVNNNNVNTDEEEPISLDIQLKQFLKNMMEPPSDNIDYNLPLQGGVGDQPLNINSTYLSEETVIENTRMVEKKSRVTDLVKNSPHIITELMDEATRTSQSKWEESEERFLQIIELDCVNKNDTPFKAHRDIIAEEVPLPDDNDDDLLPLPRDDKMDTIDLKVRSQLSLKNDDDDLVSTDGCGGKGDDVNMIIVMPPVPDPTRDNGGEAVNDITPSDQKSSDILESEIPLNKVKKRKWNLGTKIRGFFKRSNKEQVKTTSEPNPQ